ncbi:MarR family winged helix-turn-helix transcriptional regulator [Sphingomonas azotifigens]|uniref:MarR family winged helix-turn-helix transcriptional regulator n=1 Tax=Sphingomonas azotifigens TaxID=330920 RepID=UPI001C3FEFE5|nr:MarR family winged helix-turn-helix transcriptional regulator [Sphingomonas azotifigens]
MAELEMDGLAVPRPPETQDALERNLSYLVNRLSAVGQAAQNRRLAACGVNTVTLRTLSVLYIQDGLTVNEITARAFAEQSTASRAIDSMVTAGLLERRIPPGDQRRREIGLTEAGRALLLQCWPHMAEHNARLVEGIDADDLETCRRVLARMIENVRAQGS